MIVGCAVFLALLIYYHYYVPLYLQWDTSAEHTKMCVLGDFPEQGDTEDVTEIDAFIALVTSQPFSRTHTGNQSHFAELEYVYFRIWAESKSIGLHIVLPNETLGLDGFAVTEDGHIALEPDAFYDLANTYLSHGHSVT